MNEQTIKPSEIYGKFLSDNNKTLSAPRQQTQFEIYARGQKVNVNQSTYQELVDLLKKFLIWQMYG